MVDGAARQSGERGLPFLLAPEQSKAKRERERFCAVVLWCRQVGRIADLSAGDWESSLLLWLIGRRESETMNVSYESYV